MADVRDILGVPRGAASAEKADAPAKPKERMQRPAGMSREAFALLGGLHPIVPSVLTEELRKKEDLKGLKQKRKSSAKGQITWRWQPFHNPARTDDLKLEHWVKCHKDPAGKIRPADEGEYSFAKYNKKMMVYNYDEEEWTNVVPKDPEWSREETDYLISMCEQFDLRFLVITDRYEFPGGKPRCCEDLKARYYAVARALAIAREGSEESIANQIIVKHPFNAQHEKDRKKAIEMLLARTSLQDAEENKVLEAAAVIEAAQRQEAAARKAAAQPVRPVHVPAQPPPAPLPNVVVPPAVSEVPIVGTSSLFDIEVTPMWPAKPGVYVRGAQTRETGNIQLNRVSGGAKSQKAVETLLGEVGATASPEMPTRETCGAWLMLRMEVIALQEARKRLLARNAAEAGGNPEGRGKRAHKGKELETYRVFTAEQDFKYAAETFLQGQARKWLSQVLRQRLPDTSLATLLMSGCVLGRVADIVLAHVFRRSLRHTRILPQEFGERRYSAMLDDLNRFQEACKALGLRQDDLVATSDVLTGKNVTATCHALWSLATACVDQGVKGIPEFVSKGEQAQLRAESMSRTRSYEKALRLSTVIAETVHKPKRSNLSRELYLEHIPDVKPAGTDSAYSSPTGRDKDSVFDMALDDAPALSPTLSVHSDPSAADLAVATPPVSDARPRPPSAGSRRPSSAGFRLPAPRDRRPGSAGSNCSSSSSGSGVTTPLGLKLPVPVEVTRQAWAVDCSSYKGLPLRPQPIMRPRTPDSSKARAGNGQGFLAGCRDALPGLAGSIIAIAAMVLIGRSGSAPTQSTNEPESEEAQEEVAATKEDQLWVVGRA